MPNMSAHLQKLIDKVVKEELQSMLDWLPPNERNKWLVEAAHVHPKLKGMY
jgi:hypothetical protein